MIRISIAVPVPDVSAVSEARRQAQQCAVGIGFSAAAAGRVALVATELATNLVKHAGGGTILLGSNDDTSYIVSVLSIDKGPGIGSLSTVMADGYSTAGSPGTGLGAVSRAAVALDVYSLPQKGTIVFCSIEDESRRRLTPVPQSRRRIDVAGVCIPKSGESVSGDSWAGLRQGDEVTIMVADGLGHGEAAGTASMAAIRVLKERVGAELVMILQEAHGALRPTRGAAVGIMRIFPAINRADFIGVGNIAAAIVNDSVARRTMSHNGIVGQEMRKVERLSYPWPDEGILVMHSDGIVTNWSLDAYPGISQRDPALIAALIYRDFCRGTDDTTIVIAKAS